MRLPTTAWQGIIAHYRPFLPVTDQTPIVTLHEGNTPLIRARHLEPKFLPDLPTYPPPDLPIISARQKPRPPETVPTTNWAQQEPRPPKRLCGS